MTELAGRCSFKPERAYLEMARSILRMPVVRSKSIEKPLDTDLIPHDALWALTSLGYVYSHAAVVAFATGQLHQHWEKDGSQLRINYPRAKDFLHLVKTDLSELKEMLKELCRLLEITQLCEADPALWNDLVGMVKTARDFMIHPKPGDAFGEIASKVLEKNSWDKPSKTAEQTLAYFYEQCTGSVPSWVRANEVFSFTSARLLG